MSDAVPMIMRCGELQHREDEYGQPVVPYVTAQDIGTDCTSYRNDRVQETPPVSTYCDRCQCDHGIPMENVPTLNPHRAEGVARDQLGEAAELRGPATPLGS